MVHKCNSDFPISIKIEIEQVLETEITRIQRPNSGMWARTYLIGNEMHQWVVRVQKAPALGGSGR